MNNNNEDVIEQIGRLLERLQQAGGEKTSSSHYTFVYVASGAQHVENQYNQQSLPVPPRKKEPPTSGDTVCPSFDADTPLSALFRESHHKELRQIIDSWRPYLVDDDPAIDALALSNFQFDLEQTRPVCIYMDLARLINHDALSAPMSVLAAYLFLHSNLSCSENALYVQLKRYKKMCK